MREALLGESLAAGDETLFIGFLGWEDGDYIVFGVGFVALRLSATSTPAQIETDENSPANTYPP